MKTKLLSLIFSIFLFAGFSLQAEDTITNSSGIDSSLIAPNPPVLSTSETDEINISDFPNPPRIDEIGSPTDNNNSTPTTCGEGEMLDSTTQTCKPIDDGNDTQIILNVNMENIEVY